MDSFAIHLDLCAVAVVVIIAGNIVAYSLDKDRRENKRTIFPMRMHYKYTNQVYFLIYNHFSLDVFPCPEHKMIEATTTNRCSSSKDENNYQNRGRTLRQRASFLFNREIWHSNNLVFHFI